MISYILFIEVKDAEVLVGRLGRVRLVKGTYMYVGSARRGLFKRLERHFSKEKRVFWHIDRITILFKPCFAFITNIEERVLAQRLKNIFKYVEGFGSSDDPKAPSHLFYSPKDPLSTLRLLVDIIDELS